jgi:hypothetical protein
MTETITLDTLPEKPTGWTKHMVLHMNFGRAGGSMTYAIHDEQGREVVGLGMGYDTRIKQGRSEGFYIVGKDTGYLSWSEVRERWNADATQAAQGVENG